MMKVSVIVPVYNVEDYLPECIESVLEQTYQECEVILVNDGSTDGSTFLCDQYAFQNPHKVKVIHTNNRGPLHARSIGIAEAEGDVLIFLDADDCLCNNALELIVGCFVSKEADMVLFNTGECAKFATIQVLHSFDEKVIFCNSSKVDIYRSIVTGQLPNSVCLKAVRASCANIPKHFFEINATHGEDLLLSVHLITNCNKIVYLNEGIYIYRNRPGSSVHSFNIQRKESIKVVHTEIEKYIEKWNIPELIPLHNARKVRGWVNNLILLLDNKKYMSKKETQLEIESMAHDPYFINAFDNMDRTQLSRYNYVLAWCLNKRHFFACLCVHSLVKLIKTIKYWRYHD